MLYYEHESLFTRSPAACPASRGSRNITSRDCENIRGLGSNDQTLHTTALLFAKKLGNLLIEGDTWG